MALSHACVSAMVSSSRSTRLRPSWLPSVVATRLATGMKSGDAGILSSARSRLANLFLFLGRLFAFAAVGCRLDLASRRRLELFAPALGRRDAVLDGLADRVVRVGHCDTRPLRRLLGPLYRPAAAQLDRLAAPAVHLAERRARGDVCARGKSCEAAKDDPSETASAAALLFSHRYLLIRI